MGDLKKLAASYKIEIPKKIDNDDTVLIIEDQQDLRLIITHHLQKLGFRKIKQCSNGLEAIQFLKGFTGKISVTLCDQEMPVMGGIDFLQEVMGSENLSRGPFCIAIDNPNREKIMLATENGVDGVMVKPLTLKDIMPKVNQTFRIYHNPSNPELLYDLAKQKLNNKNLDDAYSIYEQISKVAKNTARPFVGMARVLREKKQFDEALAMLDQAQTNNENFVHTYVEKGKIYVEKGSIEKAVEQYKKAIEISPLNPLRYEEAVGMLFKLERYEEGVEILKSAIEKELQFSSLHHYMSQGYFALQDYVKAIKHIRLALHSDPENVTYLNQLGICFKESEDFQEAMKTYNSIIKLDPANKAALFNKAILLHSMGQPEDAVKILERCIVKHPTFLPAKTKLNEYKAALSKAG